jgi:hypothetical protein
MFLEGTPSSETSDLTRATRRNIPEDAILHSHRREKLKSYNFLRGHTLFRLTKWINPAESRADSCRLKLCSVLCDDIIKKSDAYGDQNSEQIIVQSPDKWNGLWKTVPRLLSTCAMQCDSGAGTCYPQHVALSSQTLGSQAPYSYCALSSAVSARLYVNWFRQKMCQVVQTESGFLRSCYCRPTARRGVGAGS